MIENEQKSAWTNLIKMRQVIMESLVGKSIIYLNDLMVLPFQKQVILMGICSFSSVFDNVLLWLHNADSRNRICFEFNTNTFYILPSSERISLKALAKGFVEYSESFPIVYPNTDENIFASKNVKIIFTKS